MSVEVGVEYTGDLHCVATHGPSGERLLTDAPVDNQGKGEFFSPTDLLGTAMGTCMLTIMGIAAKQRGIEMTGTRATVSKEMSAVPRRHISRLAITITLPAGIEASDRPILEAAARGCPVHASLGPDTRVDLDFVYG